MSNSSIILSALGVIVIAIALFFYSPREAVSPVEVPVNTATTITQETQTMPESIQGLSITVTKEGSGVPIATGQTAVVDYTGMFSDGKVFDSSIPRGEPFSFTIGKGMVIKGWDLGVVGMKVGESRKLVIAPELAYGAGGYGPIPPQSTLTFEVTLRAIK